MLGSWVLILLQSTLASRSAFARCPTFAQTVIPRFRHPLQTTFAPVFGYWDLRSLHPQNLWAGLEQPGPTYFVCFKATTRARFFQHFMAFGGASSTPLVSLDFRNQNSWHFNTALHNNQTHTIPFCEGESLNIDQSLEAPDQTGSGSHGTCTTCMKQDNIGKCMFSILTMLTCFQLDFNRSSIIQNRYCQGHGASVSQFPASSCSKKMDHPT